MTSAPTVDQLAGRQGTLLVHALHILMKTAQIHEPTNVAVEQPVARVMEALNGMGLEEVCLQVRGDHVYLGETRLKIDIESFHSVLWLIEEMQRREVGSILFKDSVGPEEIKRFAYLFVQLDPNAPDPYEALAEQMRSARIAAIEIEKYREETVAVPEAPRDLKEAAKETYARAVSVVTEVVNDSKLGKAVGFRKAKRLVQSLVDFLFQEEHTLVGLTTLRCYDEYTHNHSVNVCILSLMLSSRLGYSRKQLSDMGVAFLFHDLGKVNVPLDVLNKPSGFTEEEWNIMRTHPVQGVKTMIKMKGLGDPMISMMVSASFEHHLGYDGTGYPKLVTPWPQSLIGRIAAIADCYDAMTASRVYRREPMSPENTLQFMLKQSGTSFDPGLLKLFINSIGIYPIGTLVLLDTRELAVVVQANARRIHRPKVKLITNRAGDEVDGEVVDLAACEERTGRYDQSILRVVDNTKYNIDVSRYFV
jgi:HD-GYP domain-containing protein (c-di-GMP phosphodiesterase class II)